MSTVGALLGLALLLFELVLVVRVVLDWVGVLVSPGAGEMTRVRGWTHAVTEPVIRPVRRFVRPLRLGSVSVDLAFTAVFVAVIVLRSVALSL
jgi:YggT family protein